MPGADSTARSDLPVPFDRVAELIDHTLLRPDATAADIGRLCAEADQYGFCSVCVNPLHVTRARHTLRNPRVVVCTVAGFPLGADRPETKVFQTRCAIADGAREIDMVIDIGALRAGEDRLVLEDIRAVVDTCRQAGALCKVILETSLLSDAEKVRGAELTMAAGADFVKTSTGFAGAGATVDDVALLRRTVAPGGLGVKAAGGIRSFEDFVRMVAAGATRIGSSRSVQIMEQAAARRTGERG